MWLSRLDHIVTTLRALAVHVRGRRQTRPTPQGGYAGAGKICTQVQYFTGQAPTTDGESQYGGWDRRISIRRRNSEIERRSRPKRRLHPHAAAVPLDGLPAECESKSVPRVFFPVQALEHAEYAAVERRVNTKTVVAHREDTFEVRPPG